MIIVPTRAYVPTISEQRDTLREFFRLTTMSMRSHRLDERGGRMDSFVEFIRWHGAFVWLLRDRVFNPGVKRFYWEDLVWSR